MKAPRTRIASTIADRSLNKADLKELSKEVAAFLIAEGRTAELESILRDVQSDWAEAGYVEVIAKTAHPLPAESVSQIEAQAKRVYPNAKTIKVTEVRDESVLGGVQLFVANQQLDLSVENKLNTFKRLVVTGKEQ